MLFSLLHLKQVNLTQLTLAFPSDAKRSSRYRRLQHFFQKVSFDYDTTALLLMKNFGFYGKNYYLALSIQLNPPPQKYSFDSAPKSLYDTVHCCFLALLDTLSHGSISAQHAPLRCLYQPNGTSFINLKFQRIENAI